MDKTPESKEAMQESFLLLRRNSIQKLFNGYEYDIEQQHHQAMQEMRRKKIQNREVVVKNASMNSLSGQQPQQHPGQAVAGNGQAMLLDYQSQNGAAGTASLSQLGVGHNSASQPNLLLIQPSQTAGTQSSV